MQPSGWAEDHGSQARYSEPGQEDAVMVKWKQATRNREQVMVTCDTGTDDRPCRGCPDCQVGPAVSLGENDTPRFGESFETR
jgi:hypothetical protein